MREMPARVMLLASSEILDDENEENDVNDHIHVLLRLRRETIPVLVEEHLRLHEGDRRKQEGRRPDQNPIMNNNHTV